MEIKSIKKIKNVGVFSSFKEFSLRFEKLNFIYGLNTYGKTTLTYIFESLKNNNSEKIVNRKTIPNQDIDQEIILSVKENEQEKEKEIKFQNQKWENNNSSEYIEVFGTDFIHRNVFTGLEVDRKNKVNFTQFILGDEGVSLANKIADDRRILQEEKKKLQTDLPDFIKDKGDEEKYSFLDYKIEELDKKGIEKELIKLGKEKQNEEQGLSKQQEILSLPVINSFDIPESKILEYLKNINELLQKDFLGIKNEVFEKITKHIQNNFHYPDGAENWIKQGLSNCKDKSNCSFCGQNLQNAQDLIDVYHSYFDVTYNKFIKEIEQELSTQVSNFQNQEVDSKNRIQKILIDVLKYQEFITDKIFQESLVNFDNKLKELNENDLKRLQKTLLDTLKAKIEEKNKKPYQKIDIIDVKCLENSFANYEKNLNELNTVIKKIKNKTEELKKQYKNAEVTKNRIIAIDKNIEKLEFQKARIEQDIQCKEYKQKLGKCEEIKRNIDGNSQDLQNNQSNYLQKYFNNINPLFKKLGSENFTLEKTESSRGHQPIYFLNVKFHGENIKHEDLQNVFSESDKRALAFAIFWSKIDLKNKEEKSKTVVILDDPVTSFDDNRITKTVDLMKENLQHISQIIVLTHYQHFIRRFCEITKEKKKTTKFFQLDKDNKTSQLKSIDRKHFTESQYEKIFSKIMGYIDKEHNNCIKSDLRPFFESLYIPTIFAKELRNAENDKKDLTSLNKVIDEVFKNNQNIKEEMHKIRRNLNPDCHIFTSTNKEDVRNFARNIMKFLYSFELNNENMSC